MQMVADEAGASKETLYRHSGRNDDLVIEVVGSRDDRLRSRLEANVESDEEVGAVCESSASTFWRA